MTHGRPLPQVGDLLLRTAEWSPALMRQNPLFEHGAVYVTLSVEDDGGVHRLVELLGPDGSRTKYRWFVDAWKFWKRVET